MVLTRSQYEWQAAARADDAEPYVLHDGPLFANSHKLHMGHLVNKGGCAGFRRRGTPLTRPQC